MSRGRHLLLSIFQLAILATMLVGLQRLLALLPSLDGVGPVAGVGLLLLGGVLAAAALGSLGVPQLTSYLLVGILVGPHGTGLLDREAVRSLSQVNALALALIALAGGAELSLGSLRSGMRSLAWATALQSGLVLCGVTVVVWLLRGSLSFTSGLSASAALGAAMLVGALSTTRSPAAALAILAETRADGPLSRFSLNFIMLSDVVVVLLLAAVQAVARVLILPDAEMSLEAFSALGHELLGTVALGTTLGLLLLGYLKLVGRQMVLVLVALGFVFSEVVLYLHFEPLLCFIVAGFIVCNLSDLRERFMEEVHALGGVVMVIFFAIAGAGLNLQVLRELWPYALVLCGARAAFTWIAGRASAVLAKDDASVKHWGFSGMIAQAGFSLGVAPMVVRDYPQMGASFVALAVATVAINQLIGPVLFKVALGRAGEIPRAPPP